jgi:DNA-binding transcriptional LysR family regulator
MELYELRYFLGVAKFENIHKASEKMGVSPASLSKAIARLEAELGVSLFSREKRNIHLTDRGRLLQKRAAEMAQMEEAMRLELAGAPGTFPVVMAGPEILLAKLGVGLGGTIKRKFPGAVLEFLACTEKEAIAKIESGEAHIALLTGEAPSKPGLVSKMLEETAFKTYVGKAHPLFKAAKAKSAVPVEDVLLHPFVSPGNPFLGKVGARQSLDGWRDDQFPRKVEFVSSSLKTLEEILLSGQAVAYLPSYFGSSLEVEALRVTGCPYTCVQKIKLLAKNPRNIGWLNQIF